MTKLLLVCLGGAIGSGARYLLSTWALALFGAAFPYGTLAVNAIGCFVIAVVMRLGVDVQLIPPAMRLFLTTGLMGGFTTYSAFDYETFRYTQEGAYGLAVLYVGLTLAICFVAGIAGDVAAKTLVGG